MVTWTVEQGTVNQEGNVVTFPFTVVASFAELGWGSHPENYTKPDPDTTNDTLEIARKGGLIGAVKGRVFSAKDGKLALDVDTRAASVVVVDLAASYNVGSATATFTFTLSLKLVTVAYVAINNDSIAPLPAVNGLSAAWIKLWFIDPLNGSQSFPSGSAPAILAADLVFDPAPAGKIPRANDGSQDHLRLSVDAHAQWVQPPSGAKANLGTWNDLTGVHDLLGAGTSVPDLTGNSFPPPPDPADPARGHFDYATPLDPGRFTTDPLVAPPVIGSHATIGVFFRADDTHPIFSTVVGRWNSNYTDPNGRSWRVFVDNEQAPRMLTYQTDHGGTVTDNEFMIGDGSTPTLFLLRRDASGSDNVQAWIDGRPQELKTANATVDDGDGVLSVGARQDDFGAWIESFPGDLRQVALYDSRLDEYQMSLLMHIMAQRAIVDLGTPIPTALQHQPYDPASNPSVPQHRILDRRPIAVINLHSALYTNNLWGQSINWRPTTGTDAEKKAAIKDWLRPQIRAALVGCDQFEIMFNRPVGGYVDDVPTSSITGVSGGEDSVQDFQWAAMSELWTEFGIADYNDDKNRLRRGWFYVGAGLPLDDDGAITITGHMGRRFVAPLDAATFLSGALEQWTDQDGRFRCLFLDAAINFYGKFVEVVQDPIVYESFTLVAEAIPQSGFDGDPPAPTVPKEYAARKGAPWFALARNADGPWWNLNNPPPSQPKRTAKDSGYNQTWQAGAWNDTPIYFGVLDSGYLDLRRLDRPQDVFTLSNMTLGDIYRWARKGATPMAFYSQFAKVGAAWDYATGRVAVSRFANSPRISRVARV